LGRPAWVAYLGDDITDEDAFRAITAGISILVGLRPTAATHKLNGIADVDQFLRSLMTRGAAG
jgi:trehalose-phosphatase